MDSRLNDYVEGVSSGKIIACKEVRQAVERFKKDLLRDDLEFREDKVDKVIRFIEILQHSAGDFNNMNFILEPWQIFIVSNLFGFYWKEDDRRRFRTAYIEVARKNGKTALIAAIAMYMLFEEYMSKVYLAANSRKQVLDSDFEAIYNFTQKLDHKGKYLKRFRDTIKYDKGKSSIQVLASDATKLDSLNPSCYIVDEYHEMANNKLLNVLKSGTVSRKNPLGIIITTAGFHKSYPCYNTKIISKEVLSGIKNNDSFFTIIYTQDNKKEINNPDMWIKSNPNLGISVFTFNLKSELEDAKLDPSKWTDTITKNFNIWCDTSEAWLSDDDILKCTQKVNLEDFSGCDCYIGMDLSTTSDMTVTSYMINKDNKKYFKTYYYLPEDSNNAKKDIERYNNLQRQGYLIFTPGNVVDYEYIINDVLEKNKILNIKRIGYDSWNATQTVVELTKVIPNIHVYAQSIGNYSKPTYEMERLVLKNEIVIDNNPLNREHFRNVVLTVDRNGNKKPDKSKNKNKIDGVIGMITALGMYLDDPDKNTNNYEIYTINF